MTKLGKYQILSELATGAIASSSGMIATNGWAPTLSGSDAALAESVITTLAAAGAEPPSSEELAEQLGPEVGRVLRFLDRRGDIVQVDTNRYYTSNNLKLLIDRLRNLMVGGAEASPAEIREGLGLSRKFLIPFLEYCDRVGYTNRNANGRVWRGT